MATLSSLRKFSEHIYVYDPPAHNDKQTTKSTPTKIVLFTWADAPPRLVEKYFMGYHELYPSAKIIIVMARTMSTFFGGQETAKSFVKEMVTKELYNNKAELTRGPSSSVDTPMSGNDSIQPNILMHAFSNSGGLNLEAVSAIWHAMQRSAMQKPGPLPIKALILDSTPGGTSFFREFPRWTSGVALGFAFLPKFLAKLVAGMIVTVLMGLPILLGRESMPQRGRRVINSPTNIPVDSARLYIYSKADPLIHDKDVEQHAREAKEKGYKQILLEKFPDSGHVAHMRQDPSRYWAAIAKFWDGCCV
ncbi:hypothetical protein FE257_001468 [Aspergillus nanangensis]|uniref:DUF829-domain-containing protein n=1 Tax=Aspergillus nanangensis TaxID=2582783 RepID=A0AAD4CDP5_ASPNN|nr:hypothetical protein FE257_001468 [Aspergillus nanangensis]